MEAVVIGMQELRTRTPRQVLSAFLAVYSADQVELFLWEVYRGFAVNDEKGLPGLTVREAEVAVLLDNLIDLVAAVQLLEQLRGAGDCPYCLGDRKPG